MSVTQKILKFASIAFGIILSIGIISMCVGLILGVFDFIFVTEKIYSQITGEETSIISDITGIDNIERNTYEFDNISSVDINLINAKLEIKKSDSDKVRVEVVSELSTVEVENNNDELDVIEDSYANFLGMRIKSDYDKNEIIIYLPEKEYDNIHIDLGNGETNILELNAKSIQIHGSTGNVEIENIISEYTGIFGSSGDINIEKLKTKDILIDTNIGNIDINAEIDGEGNIDSSTGTLNLNLLGGKDKYQLDLDYYYGDISVDGESVTEDSILGTGDTKLVVTSTYGTVNISHK